MIFKDVEAARSQEPPRIRMVSGCFKAGRPQGTVHGGSIKDLLYLPKNPDIKSSRRII